MAGLRLVTHAQNALKHFESLQVMQPGRIAKETTS